MAILTRLSTSIHLQPADERKNPTEVAQDEERRRCFWAIFMLDRFHSTATGLPHHFSEEEINTRLPCLENEFQISRLCSSRQYLQDAIEETDHWAYCVESASLLGRVNEYLRINKPSNGNGMALGLSIEEWWSKLPREITVPKNVGKDEIGNLILLHATYNTYLLQSEFC
jgi:hypothetical protein